MAAQVGTFTASLEALHKKGVRYGTVIDLGCADGSFFLFHYCLGLFPGAVGVNIDANPIYESSLRAIQEVMGGHYRIAAASDAPGELQMTTSTHPYWNSLRPPDDPYWDRVNGMREGAMTVPAITLDELAEELQLEPPFLIKLDIQGAETAALRGARKVLSQTDVVVCEADLDDFASINRCLEEAGFGIFDLTQLARLTDQTLGWFYPVYLNHRLDGLKQRHVWNEAANAATIEKQLTRRKEILYHNTLMLMQQRIARR